MINNIGDTFKKIFFKHSINKKQAEVDYNYRYNCVLSRLRNEIKYRKLNVVFLNGEVAKWAYQDIYEELSKDERFNTTILITIPKIYLKKKYEFLNCKQSAKNNFDYFRKKRMNVDYAFDFDNNKPIDLDKFKPDIFFYDEPTVSLDIHSIDKTSDYALSLYCSYGSCTTNGKNEYPDVYKKLFCYFVDNAYTKSMLLCHGFNENNIEVVGHPKLDNYLNPIDNNNIIWKSENKKRIIYAPHFSFFKKSKLGYGTFNWNYKYFYEFAHKHPEYEFILKPHPSLKRHIVREKLMTINEMQNYFNAWDNLDNAQVCEGGNYIDMFRTSDVLITDCNSFLFEYLPTTKPVIHLIGKYSVGFNEYGEKLIKGYYKAKNIKELQEQMEYILISNKDELKPIRENIINKELTIPKNGVRQEIKNYILKILNCEV